MLGHRLRLVHRLFFRLQEVWSPQGEREVQGSCRRGLWLPQECLLVDRNDSDDPGRGPQLRRLRLHRCHSRHSPRRPLGGHLHRPVGHIPEGASEHGGKGGLLLVHRGLRRHRHERPGRVVCLRHPRDAALRDPARLPQLCGSHHRGIRHHCLLRWPEVGQEEHAGLYIHLQLGRRAECGCDPGTGRGDRRADRWKGTVQPVVHLCATCLCDRNPPDGDHLPQCE